MSLRETDVVDGTAVPTIGRWRKGDMVINTSPSATTPAFWLCTVSGEPGTWISVAQAGAVALVGGTGAATVPYVLAKSAVAVSGAANTSENVLATVTIPAGAMGPNGVLRLESMWSFTGSANSKTLRARLGGIGGTAYLGYATTTASHIAFGDQRRIMNRNSAASQVGANGTVLVGGLPTVFAFSATAATTSTIDTSAATTLVFTGEKATGAETLTLESYLVEVLYGA
jgi:hypothetical protein